MGNCKENQTPRKIGGLFKRVKDSLMGRKEEVSDSPAENFADYLEKADEALTKMIIEKDVEAKNGSKGERKKLEILELQAYHLEKTAELAIEYTEL